MRSALLASKRAIDSKASSNREELLRSSVLKQSKSPGGKSTYVDQSLSLEIRSFYRREDVVMKARSDVTDALRRTMTLMQSELEKSVLSTQMLGEFFHMSPPHQSLHILHRGIDRVAKSHILHSRHAHQSPWRVQTARHGARKGRLVRSIIDFRGTHILRARRPFHTQTAHRRPWATHRVLVDPLFALPKRLDPTRCDGESSRSCR